MADRSLLLKGFCLSEWLVTPEDGSLRSPTMVTRLEPLLMELLLLLCSREGRVVSKQDLLDTVWSGRFVSDETIKGSLYQLRKMLAMILVIPALLKLSRSGLSNPGAANGVLLTFYTKRII